MLELVGLRDRGGDPYKTYSLGMKQRLGIASTLLRDPRLIILDEPTNGVDPVSRRDFWRILYQLIREKVTIDSAGKLLEANAERHLKAPAEMARLFRDHPEAVTRSVEIAARIRFSLDELRYEYPDAVVPAGTTAAEYLAETVWRGAAKRYPDGVPEKVKPPSPRVSVPVSE